MRLVWYNMPWLAFVGLGLKLKDITLEALEVLNKADKVFLDTYTSISPDINVTTLSNLLRKEIIPLKRADIEDENAAKIFNELARGRNVAFAIIGDPFIATTHMALLLEAVRRNVDVRVVHGLTIYSVAISYSGLMIYKFGRCATIVYPKEGIFYDYFYYVIKENMKLGLHTLLLLELDVDKGIFMTANDALKLMVEAEKKRRENVISEETRVLVIARAGTPTQKFAYGKIISLIKEDFGPPPHTLIVPGRLHYIEEDALKRFLID